MPLESYQTELFELSAAPAAAEGYPMETMEGQFINSDGSTFPVAPQYLQGEWGSSSVGWGVGNPNQPAPDSLELRWFSYPEDKFYEGHFLLPQKRIYELLKQGFYNTKSRKQETYYTLTVCVLPTGVVVVWLSGDQNKVVIGRYQGWPIHYDFKQFNEAANRPRMIAQERAKMPPQVQAQIKAGTLSTAQWDAYLKTYPWRLEVVEQTGTKDRPAFEPLPLYDYFIRYQSAAYATYPPDSTKQGWQTFLDTLQQPVPKAVPNYFGLMVQNRYGEKHQLRVDPFDEAQTLAAFQTLHQAHPNETIVLRVAVDKAYANLSVSLGNGFQTIPLDKATTVIFEEE